MGKHLSYEQRCQIYVLQGQGLTQKAIAAGIGSNQSVVSRELKRNRGQRGYRCKQAQELAEDRRHAAGAMPHKMTADMIALIVSKLRDEQLSPEQISGWMRETKLVSVSHECIYQHIWADKRAGGKLYKHLRRTGKKYNKRKGTISGRGLIPNRIDISERPAIVDRKARIGDWEADTIVGSEHKGAILSLVERKSKYTLLHKLDAATADSTTNAIIAKMKPHKKLVHTITADNGKEFAGHQEVAARLKTGFYFATPYHAWERGLNENTNGLVRQYFPKGSSFATVSNDDVQRVQNLLNSRPRKSLKFKSPNEVFFAQKSPPPNG
jgi:IS30 family transposase